MTRGRKVLLGAVIFPLAVVALYKLIYPTYVWHQKMTVDVEVDGQLHSASSVSEMRAVFGPTPLPDIPPLKLHLRGEAVVLEISGRGSLFALLSGGSSTEYSKYIATTVFHDELPERSSRAMFSKLSRLEQTRVVPPEHYPLLVTFTDIDDPTTVRRVDPNNLAAAFGPGVSLKRITLEITDEPVTEREWTDILPWWNNLEKPIGGTDQRYGGPLYAVGKWSFVRN